MVYALTQIQEYAYQTDDGRTSKNILRFTITSAMFVVRYTEIFQPDKLKATSPRAMFGAPYHSVVAHMAEMYRYISLRSVVAEACERMFGTLRWGLGLLQMKYTNNVNTRYYSLLGHKRITQYQSVSINYGYQTLIRPSPTCCVCTTALSCCLQNIPLLMNIINKTSGKLKLLCDATSQHL